jgi:hypothetical protein
MKRVVISGLVILCLAGFVAYELLRATNVTIRENPTNPLYTIGERQAYSPALANGTSVLKFGPMFFGLYPGGLAFASPQDARDYLRVNGWEPDRWSVYRLSGDFLEDSSDGYLTTSLLVLEEVKASGF